MDTDQENQPRISRRNSDHARPSTLGMADWEILRKKTELTTVCFQWLNGKLFGKDLFRTTQPMIQFSVMSKRPRLAILTLGIGGLLVSLATAAQAAAIYNFTNFNGPGSGTSAGAGTNMNGIANNGAAVGFGIDNAGNFTNFVRNPIGTYTTLNINGSTSAMALGINSAGDVVGTANGAAFILPPGGPVQSLTTLGTGSTAFGVNDGGNIVGQFSSAMGTMPGFSSPIARVRVSSPSMPPRVRTP